MKQQSSSPSLLRPAGLALAWSEALCQHGVSRPGGAVWVAAAPSAVLGISQHAAQELNLTSIQADRVAVLRRPSGGGAVILDPTVLCFEFFYPAGQIGPDLSIRESFALLTAPVCRAVQRMVGALPVMAGISDLALEDGGRLRKICGCAQMRKRQAVLVHGSILVNTEIARIERLLGWPSETPDYRARRSHTDFCLPLAQYTGAELPLSSLADAIGAECAEAGWDWLSIPQSADEAEDTVQKLLRHKYEDAGWNLDRRRPSPELLR